ncbi:MAG: DUF1653 domain-containing protein [Patescibacteria group bacterium]
MDEIKIGRYRHYKGHDIEVIGIAHHSETVEEMVVYRHLGKSSMGENDLWVRPKAMFLETVERDGKKFKRFEYVED